MQTNQTRLLFAPTDDLLRFLPEGPYPCGPGKISWVAIQHGAESETGSINQLDLATGENQTFELDGRPGFAFPTSEPDVFVVGLERRIELFNVKNGAATVLCDSIDADVSDTIVNDGVVFDDGLIFGTKHLKFSKKIAGLYLWRRQDRRLIRLRGDQICSNGKVIRRRDGQLKLLDIDSPTKTVVEYTLDVAAGELGAPRVVVDVRDGEVFPDGMTMTPNGMSVIVAFYNPNDAPHGEARQYNLETGEVESTWRTPRAPQVTCPQLIEHDGTIKLVLTTAVEHMSPDRRTKHPNSGCLFIADTNLVGSTDTPRFEI